ncbi:phospholipase D-like domain-containing protein [Pseudomonas violetae]|uniref:Phospholipase D-like domain-containing protein n=1 Tax=Pseudomonas violetae TaxID=2915813 RepID=A0ABT0EU48_9PSED|nr:phospholipase D-like domain-containing protein [Pseudomonas violetae]MCK1788997.1 phospholipase D-like domain-containing protein [Pseudomonas violetae]
MIRIRQNLTKTWQSQFEGATTQITVLSPYITPNDTLPLLKDKDARIYTLFQVRDFVSGASDIKFLTSLVKAKHQVYELKTLHAKVVMDEDSFVTLGSQNLTDRGAGGNLELNVCFDGTSREITCDMVRSKVESWIAKGKPRLITGERIKQMEKRIEAVREAYEEFNGQAQKEQDAADAEDALLGEPEVEAGQTERQRADESNWIEIRKKVRKASASTAVHQGVISCYDDRTPFLRFTAQDLLHWPRKDGSIEQLYPRKRYLCILNEREFGWARLAKTQITRIAQHITLGRIIPGLPKVEVELWAQGELGEKAPPGTNLVAILLIDDELVCTVPMRYLLANPEVKAAIPPSRSAVDEVRAPPKETKAVLKWLRENPRKFKLAISKHIASNNDAPGHRKTYGGDAQDFVGPHLTTVNMGVAFKGKNPILILTTQP